MITIPSLLLLNDQFVSSSSAFKDPSAVAVDLGMIFHCVSSYRRRARDITQTVQLSFRSADTRSTRSKSAVLSAFS